jgi:C4-dicarboxylate transporter DctQ subunit|tara:strand:- start:109 stop:618 length:510 start_codon:yes stop_codon:yes gene_type:complete
MPILRRLNEYSHSLEELLIGGLLATASVILFANVVARYIFNWGVPWAEELVRYEIVWMVFIGGSVAARTGIHIGIDILATFSPKQIRPVILLVINAISLTFCLFLVIMGSDLVAQTKMFGQVTPALQIPMWVVQMAIPVGGALMALRFFQRLIVTLRNDSGEATVENIG